MGCLRPVAVARESTLGAVHVLASGLQSVATRRRGEDECLRAAVRWTALAESIGRAAPFVSPGAGLAADTTSSFTSLRQPHDALGSWPVAIAEETRWCPGSGRWGVPRSEVKEETSAAGRRRRT